MLHGMGLGLGESMHEIETLVDKKLVQVSLSELYLFVYSNFILLVMGNCSKQIKPSKSSKGF